MTMIKDAARTAPLRSTAFARRALQATVTNTRVAPRSEIQAQFASGFVQFSRR